MRINALSAPVMVTWQLTRDCDLACLHCCTESAPGRRMPGELSRCEAMALASQILQGGVPYVMLVGGEPTIVPHFLEVAERLGQGGVQLKIETNGQTFTKELAASLARLPVRSLQVSLDGDTQAVYAKQRPGGSLEKAHAACRLAVEARLPLEITFAPTRINIHEAEAVIDRAAGLGAFRFNTGLLMRIGTAAKLWDRLVPTEEQTRDFIALLERKEFEMTGRLELFYKPLTVTDDMRAQLEEPPGTLLVLPDGRVKVSAALPHVCADLKKDSLRQAWDAYQRAWTIKEVRDRMKAVIASPERLGEAMHMGEATSLPQLVSAA